MNWQGALTIIGVIGILLVTSYFGADYALKGMDKETCGQAHAMLSDHLEHNVYPGYYVSAEERAACKRVGDPLVGA